MSDVAAPSDATALVFECDLDARPEAVWRALTTPEIVAEWLGPNTMTCDSEKPFVLELLPEEGGVVACELLEASPPDRLSYAWRVRDESAPGGFAAMEVTFTLAPMAQGGTHLRIVHAAPVPEAMRQSHGLSMLVGHASHERRRPQRRPRRLARPAPGTSSPIARLCPVHLRRAA